MARLFNMARRRKSSVLRAMLAFGPTMVLATSLWIVSLPIVQAAQMTPAELIQSKLPGNNSIADASDAQLLDAVYKSVQQTPKEAALIVRTAAGVRKALRSSLLCRAVQAQRDKHALNCTWVANTLRAWIKSDPKNAGPLTESAAQCAKECSETLEMNPPNTEGQFDTPPNNINPPPGLGGGSNGGGSAENQCMVCRNGKDMQIGCPAVDSFLRTHPGTTRGPCQATPTTNL